MALPAWLQQYAEPFITAYGKQVFGQNWDPGSFGQPQGLPADVQQQTAPFTPYQNQALEQVGGITPYAQGFANTTANQLGSTMSGAYLDPSSNPYLQGTFNSAASDVTNAYKNAVAPGNVANFQRAGQFGSTAMAEQGQLNQYALGQNLQNLASNIYGTNYQNERQRQIQAASMAPATTANLYAPSNTLYGAGAQQQQQNQNVMDTGYANAVARYEAPYNELSGYGGAILQSGGGGETTSTTKVQGGGGGSVICTLLHSKGLVDDETYEAAGEFGKRQSEEMRKGYRSWAMPLTRALDKSPLLMLILRPFWTAWQKEMRSRVKGGKGSLLGKALLAIGMPLSEWIGRRRTTIPAQRQEFREKITILQRMMEQMPDATGPEDYPLRHWFTPKDERYGIHQYARAIFVPKGTRVVSKIQRFAHFNFIMKGKVRIFTEDGDVTYEAPAIFVSQPGAKRAVLHLEDTIYATLHLTRHAGEQNLDKIEDELIAKTYADPILKIVGGRK